MKTALVHDWLITAGGAEKVLQELLFLFPSPIHTLLYEKDNFPEFLQEEVHTSFLQKLPEFRKYYRFLLPLFPSAIQRLDVSQADLILSSSHAVAKGVRKQEGQTHICYCHTPMRYVWDLQKEYLSSLPLYVRGIAKVLLERLRRWDANTSPQVDFFIANSHYVAERIKNNYHREARVIYPPVAVEQFYLSSQKEEYYITHARLVPYKRIDLLIETFNQMPDKTLVIIGEGPENKKLRLLAKKNIEFTGYVTNDVLAELLSRAKAYVFGADEDFGIGVVEAQSSGLPVIALKKGGARETVIDGVTGLFFEEPTIPSCLLAIQSFESRLELFDPVRIREHALRFSVSRFRKEISEYVQEVLSRNESYCNTEKYKHLILN